MSLINNYSLAVFLLEDTTRCVAVSYDPTDTVYQPNSSKRVPKTVSFKTLDQALAVGDYVIVPTETRHGFTVGKVEEVDLAVDFSSSEQMRWVADRFDKDVYKQILTQEEGIVGKVRHANVNAAKRSMQEALFEMDPSLRQFKNGIAGPTPVAPPAPTGDEPGKRGGSQAKPAYTKFDETPPPPQPYNRSADDEPLF